VILTENGSGKFSHKWLPLMTKWMHTWNTNTTSTQNKAKPQPKEEEQREREGGEVREKEETKGHPRRRIRWSVVMMEEFGQLSQFVHKIRTMARGCGYECKATCEKKFHGSRRWAVLTFLFFFFSSSSPEGNDNREEEEEEEEEAEEAAAAAAACSWFESGSSVLGSSAESMRRRFV